MSVAAAVPEPLVTFKPLKRARTLRCILLAAAVAASWVLQAGPGLAQGAPKVRVVTGNGDFLVDVRPAASGPTDQQKPAFVDNPPHKLLELLERGAAADTQKPAATDLLAFPAIAPATLATAATPEPAPSPAPEAEPALSAVQAAQDTATAPNLALPAGAASGATEAVESAVRAWANAWAGKDLNVYFSSYGQGFAPLGNQARKEWEESRRARIAGKSRISVKLSGLAIAVRGSQATARFKQHYSADALNISSQKTLELTKEADERWVIVRETTGS
jgi:ketosteroid isomerase-like protein